METLFYTKLDRERVRCGICCHYCVIEPGRRGLCNVRENRAHVLESLVYPKVVARAIDPVEKKPLFHLKPGSTSYSIATVGCNFRCSFCQNADIAQMPTDHNGLIRGVDMEPSVIVAQAMRAGCRSISFTYTEPAVFVELVLETATLAREKGLLNIVVTNGYMSPEVIRALSTVIDAANVDLKAFSDAFYRHRCGARLEPVKDNLVLMRSLGMLVEVTTLVIPGLNDDPEELKALAGFIAGSLGVDTPWHISRFHPCYRLTDRERTPVTTLEKAYALGKEAGLRYVYTGNVPGLDTENTYCHACNELLIRRVAYTVDSRVTARDTCPACQAPVYGRF